MKHWFLSYHSQDGAMAQRLEQALKAQDPDRQIFFAPKSLQVGGMWTPALADAIARSDAFILLVGDKGVGPWQIVEYNEGLDRHVKAPDYPLVLVLASGASAPGLPFLRQLHWIVSEDPTSEASLGQLVAAVSGRGSRPQALWRHTTPYRGLAAMTEADCDFMCGREDETRDVLETLAACPDRLSLLLGNSGVGKSSLAQAGVVAALKRGAWPERIQADRPWPQAFKHSKGWCYLRLVPGSEPVRALVEAFLATWQLDPTRPQWAERRAEWVKSLLDGTLEAPALLDATERRWGEIELARPSGFFVYVDQGEELYTRADPAQQVRFSALLAGALADPRLTGLMSLRADFAGRLQNDAPLYAVHRQINVPPMREAALRRVVGEPARLLSARFETETLAADIARRTAEESVKDAGSLPLLSYLLDDMWTLMVERDDGVLRLPPHAVELGGVLIERANAFLARNPQAEASLRRAFTLKLATVRADSDPTRRRAPKSEFSDAEWQLVSELADHPHRIVVTGVSAGGEVYAEVAHEAIFRRWETLRAWMADEREFLVWKSGLEANRLVWVAAPDRSKEDALLMGLALAQAEGWLAARAEDLSPADRAFVGRSLARERAERDRRRTLRRRLAIVGVAALVAVSAALAYSLVQYGRAERLQVQFDVLRAAVGSVVAKFDRNVYGAPPGPAKDDVRRFVVEIIGDLKETAAILQEPAMKGRIARGVGARRILWVDPNPARNAVEAEALEKLGLVVETVASPAEAVERLRTSGYDLILTHYGNRPGGPEQSDAYQLMAHLKRDGLPDIPVVIYSISVTDAYACAAQKRGFYDETSSPALLLRSVMRSVEHASAPSRCKPPEANERR